MRINFLVNHVNGGWEPTDKRLGGTEESVVRWAEELAKRGHEIHVYRNGRGEIKYTDLSTGSGVYWSEREDYIGGGDICINIKSSEVAPKESTLYLTNETDASSLDLSRYDGVIWPSKWAKDNIPVNNNNIFIVPHGYDETQIFPTSKTKKQCLYSSSPDRGLDILAQIWPSVVDKHPEATLYVSYNGFIDAPNVVCGEFSEEEMNRLYNTSDFWLHPCTGGELFGISAIKAQASQAIPVYFPTMALTETVKVGIPCLDARGMYETLVDVLDDEKQKFILRNQMKELDLPTWEKSTNELESAIISICK
jgi:glycosyltransferase involved in cell wall biosynthesis